MDTQPERVLVVTAHPDDVDFGAGGTVRGWIESGSSVSYCICTDGDAGGVDRDIPRSEIPRIRRQEQRDAGLALGVTDIHFLGYKDGDLQVTQDLRRDISRVIRQVRPHRILIQSPERNWHRIPSSHPDHMAAGEAAIFAVYPDARNPFAHPELLADEGLDAWTVHDVWVMGSPDPNHYVDATNYFPHKLAALRAHASQTAHMEDLEGRIRMWMTTSAADGGLPDGTLAESFKVVTIP
ncbi:MAG: PIG-L family deacetylase [Candidatus Nanopelagicales bacterium]|nr:PIG-L family deacetylase [Candidatus Nanopelagicales bacterium]